MWAAIEWSESVLRVVTSAREGGIQLGVLNGKREEDGLMRAARPFLSFSRRDSYSM